jgi:hypothetical protein
MSERKYGVSGNIWNDVPTSPVGHRNHPHDSAMSFINNDGKGIAGESFRLCGRTMWEWVDKERRNPTSPIT